ncbi:hypothetical protein P7K49_006663, partial [Saguinus oedipus]
MRIYYSVAAANDSAIVLTVVKVLQSNKDQLVTVLLALLMPRETINVHSHSIDIILVAAH